MENGVSIRLFVRENTKHHGMLVTEWLLQYARRQNLPGATAIRTLASLGHRQVMHEESFWDVLGTDTVTIEFVIKNEQVPMLLDMLRLEDIHAFYVITPCHYGSTYTGSAPPS